MRILSIDGGGIRGLIPALVLADLERRAQRPVAELFDFVAGTSTGGILALALTQPGPTGRVARPASELVALYEQEGPKIFSRSLLQRIRTVDGIADEKYDDRGLLAALGTYLGDTPIADALTPVMVTSYDTQAREPVLFHRDSDVLMREAARATAAAPTYFEPLRLTVGGRDRSLVDGGVFATNPAMVAYADALGSRPSADVVMLSLGTGQLTRPLPYDQVRRWGLLEWARPIIDVVFDGVADSIQFELEALLGTDRFWRIQTALTDASDDLDDASPGNLAALRRQGEALVAESGDLLDAVVARFAPSPT